LGLRCIVKMSPKIYYCLPTYNEEKNILDCIQSLSSQDINLDVETIICLNGCTDNTEKKVDIAIKEFPKLNIRKIHSKRGKSYSQNAIINTISDKTKPLVFIDADMILKKDCIKILYKELMRVNSLLVVGSWPLPKNLSSKSLFKRLWYEIFHVRAFHPESEISKNNVLKFKNYVKKYPQPNINPNFEIKSKIYFHGRTFMIRNAEIFKLPSRKDVADDTFLPNVLHTLFGPGIIRTRYDAIVNYTPYTSLKTHFNTYRRIFLDKRQIDSKFPIFRESRFYEQTILNWNYILKQKMKIIFKFALYALVTRLENVLFSLLPKKQLHEIWSYNSK